MFKLPTNLFHDLRRRDMRRARFTPLTFLLLAGFLLVTFLHLHLLDSTRRFYSLNVNLDLSKTTRFFRRHRYRPQPSFRDALLPDQKYITSWTTGGLTQSFISHVNLIYLAMLSQRIPVLTSFVPIHPGEPAGVIRVSEIFDLDYLSKQLRMEILEWDHLKDFDAKVKETLNCWSLRESFAGSTAHRAPYTDSEFSLNLTFTAAPNWTKLSQGADEYYSDYMSLAELTFPSGHERALGELKKKKQSASYAIPDEQMMCFDLLYYTAGTHRDEWERDWSPGWRHVGTHMRWNSQIQSLAKGMVDRVLGRSRIIGWPKKFISVHIRRSDFKSACPKEAKECLPPLSSYAKLVKEVQHELFTQRCTNVTDVIVTSDETNPAWWDAVESLGWKRINHTDERTAEKYGDWFVPVLDVVVQSLSVGFVGTGYSTLSTVSARRVIDWNEGIAKILRWDPNDPMNIPGQPPMNPNQ